MVDLFKIGLQRRLEDVTLGNVSAEGREMY